MDHDTELAVVPSGHHVLENRQAGNTTSFALLRKITRRWCGKRQISKSVLNDRLLD